MMELFNEIILMNLLYCIMCFSDLVLDVEAHLKVGYIACVLVALHWLVHLILILNTSFKDLIRKMRMKNFKKVHD